MTVLLTLTNCILIGIYIGVYAERWRTKRNSPRLKQTTREQAFYGLTLTFSQPDLRDLRGIIRDIDAERQYPLILEGAVQGWFDVGADKLYFSSFVVNASAVYVDGELVAYRITKVHKRSCRFREYNYIYG